MLEHRTDGTDVFDTLYIGGEKPKKSINTSFGSAYGGFSYADDWDAWK
ncbi:MAG: hypothetical protein IKT00_12630 [Prevotella sp.]|nr:hypothetical protein [Prevotella sp.]